LIDDDAVQEDLNGIVVSDPAAAAATCRVAGLPSCRLWECAHFGKRQAAILQCGH